MRVIYGLFLLIFLAAAGLFAWQNHKDVTIRFWDNAVTCPLSVVIGGVYVLGMLTGWSVVGVLRRSWQRVAQSPSYPPQ